MTYVMAAGTGAAAAWCMTRPTHVHLDPRRCIDCSLCRDLAPDLLVGASVPARSGALDAMAECPAGAIRWCEGEEAAGDTG